MNNNLETMNDNLEKFEFCISSKDLTEHILKTIAGDGDDSLDKFWKATCYAESQDYRQGMIQGLCLAAMIASTCDTIAIISRGELNNSNDKEK